jgi:peptidoglycan hydrolase-like protein with peptidoglycan-binding domain
MIKKITFAFVSATVFAVPLFSLAAAVGNVSAAAINVTSVPVAVSAAGICFPFVRSLSVGASGSDVTALQEYLSQQGYFNASTTGYFGMITKAAVGNWQAKSGVAASDTAGNGIFGPLSRTYFGRSCMTGNGNNNSSTQSFSANPQSGIAPLTVQFTSTAPQGNNIGSAVDFGDNTTGTLAFVPVCSNCNARAMGSHTYASAGIYTATLTSGTCSCPAGERCNCPNIQILATTTVTVTPASTATAATSTQLNAPGSVTLPQGGIAEIRNESAYFTLESIASSSATIQITPVGCWNSFPSDPAPKIFCMLALIPIPPQTLTVGQTYSTVNYSVTLTQLASSTATFSVGTL